MYKEAKFSALNTFFPNPHVKIFPLKSFFVTKQIFPQWGKTNIQTRTHDLVLVCLHALPPMCLFSCYCSTRISISLTHSIFFSVSQTHIISGFALFHALFFPSLSHLKLLVQFVLISFTRTFTKSHSLYVAWTHAHLSLSLLFYLSLSLTCTLLFLSVRLHSRTCTHTHTHTRTHAHTHAHTETMDLIFSRVLSFFAMKVSLLLLSLAS